VVDESGARAYLGRMLRKLLTLIAICAGLVAVAEPAHAAVSMVESVQMAAKAGVPCAQRTGLVQPAPVSFSERTQEKGKPCPKPTIILVVPTVMLQADRARE
jgi:hypothetical protein